MVTTEKKRSRYSKLERKDFPFVYLMVLFPVAQFLVFWVYVNASSIVLSFQNTAGEFTWNNFDTVFKAFTKADMFNRNLIDPLKRSFILWLAGELLCFPVSLITTYVLTRKIAGHYVFRVCYIVPSLMGSIIWTMLVSEMVSVSGPITLLLTEIGVKLPDDVILGGLLAANETAFPTILAVKVLMGFIGNNAVLTGAYTRVPTELFESAQLDGADFGTELFRIAIPCISPTICTLLTFSLCSIFTCDYNVWLFTNGSGAYETSTIGYELFNLTYLLSNGGNDYGYPAALGLTLTILTMPVVIFGKWALEKIFTNVEV